MLKIYWGVYNLEFGELGFCEMFQKVTIVFFVKLLPFLLNQMFASKLKTDEDLINYGIKWVSVWLIYAT